ncbi:MAG: hypothetical protein ABSB76_23510, partial [Streptosporangiaceae bacterium]
YMTVSGHDDGSPAVAAQTPPKLGRRPRLPVVTRRRRGECLPGGVAAAAWDGRLPNSFALLARRTQ